MSRRVWALLLLVSGVCAADSGGTLNVLLKPRQALQVYNVPGSEETTRFTREPAMSPETMRGVFDMPSAMLPFAYDPRNDTLYLDWNGNYDLTDDRDNLVAKGLHLCWVWNRRVVLRLYGWGGDVVLQGRHLQIDIGDNYDKTLNERDVCSFSHVSMNGQYAGGLLHRGPVPSRLFFNDQLYAVSYAPAGKGKALTDKNLEITLTEIDAPTAPLKVSGQVATLALWTNGPEPLLAVVEQPSDEVNAPEAVYTHGACYLVNSHRGVHAEFDRQIDVKTGAAPTLEVGGPVRAELTAMRHGRYFSIRHTTVGRGGENYTGHINPAIMMKGRWGTDEGRIDREFGDDYSFIWRVPRMMVDRAACKATVGVTDEHGNSISQIETPMQTPFYIAWNPLWTLARWAPWILVALLALAPFNRRKWAWLAAAPAVAVFLACDFALSRTWMEGVFLNALLTPVSKFAEVKEAFISYQDGIFPPTAPALCMEILMFALLAAAATILVAGCFRKMRRKSPCLLMAYLVAAVAFPACEFLCDVSVEHVAVTVAALYIGLTVLPAVRLAGLVVARHHLSSGLLVLLALTTAAGFVPSAAVVSFWHWESSWIIVFGSATGLLLFALVMLHLALIRYLPGSKANFEWLWT